MAELIDRSKNKALPEPPPQLPPTDWPPKVERPKVETPKPRKRPRRSA